MTIDKFEDVIAWQKSQELTLKIYKQFKGNKEFKQFLYIAKGSCGETRSMLYLASELKYVSDQDFKIDYDLSIEISKLLTGLIKSFNF